MNRLPYLLTALLLAWTGAAAAWWNEDWSSRKQILVDAGITGAGITEALVDAPVLMRLHAGNFGFFSALAADGADLRFLLGDTTPLKFHLEKFDPIQEIALIWVRMPRISGNVATDALWMYYGNPAASGAVDAGGSYDAAQALVYHFDEVEGPPRDATDHGNHALESAARPLVAGWLGAAAQFDGSGRLLVGGNPSLAIDPARGWTFSTWIKLDEAQTDAVLLEAGAGEDALILAIAGSSLRAAYGAASTPAVELQVGKWQHIALTLQDARLLLYVDGVEAAGIEAAVPAMTPVVALGGAVDGRFLRGALDEVGIATAARSADWIKFQAHSQSPDFAVTDVGADEARDATQGATAGHFGIIVQHVFGRPDAVVEQLVIGLCVLMAAIAVMVMFIKAVYLARCSRATTRFLRAYHDMVTGAGGEIDRLGDEDDSFGDSPVFRVYRAGLDEVRARVSPAVGASFAGLSEKSLGAIRARLDALMVREGQNLNRLLVLLTIAISGGPFIGLLGTVVGVMVTFAAIAATGDVNIAAIAPGMAAALLATVAGLGVAIPSLFGYNYLSAKAKDINADMHVFADEFVAKINEVHGA